MDPNADHITLGMRFAVRRYRQYNTRKICMQLRFYRRAGLWQSTVVLKIIHTSWKIYIFIYFLFFICKKLLCWYFLCICCLLVAMHTHMSWLNFTCLIIDTAKSYFCTCSELLPLTLIVPFVFTSCECANLCHIVISRCSNGINTCFVDQMLNNNNK